MIFCIYDILHCLPDRAPTPSPKAILLRSWWKKDSWPRFVSL